MKPTILIFGLALLIFSCNQNKLEGAFIYTQIPNEKTRDESLFSLGVEIGRELACSSVGVKKRIRIE